MRRRLSLLREKSGMTGDHVQEMVAKITGIDRGTINGYCTMRLPLGKKNGTKIAAALDLGWPDLLEELSGAADDGRDELGLLLARLEAAAPADRFLAGVVEALTLLARRLDVAEQRAASRGRHTGPPT